MAITINGSGTVTGISVGGLPDCIVDTDMIAANAVTGAKRGAGAILQVVNAVYSAAASFTTSGSTFQDTGLTASITSSNNNKILVTYQLECGAETSYRHACRLVRGSTDILLANSDGDRIRATNSNGNPPNNVRMSSFSQTYLDSPGAGTHTYKLMGWAESGGDFFINRSEVNSDSTSHSRGVSTMTLMEVAA